MQTRSGDFYEVTVRYDQMQEDGGLKKVTEVFSIDALSFSEAESRMISELKAYAKSYQNYEVKAIKKAAYKEVFFSEDNDIKYYNATLSFITLDEKTDKEKHSNVNYLVMATSLKAAIKHIDEVMGKTMMDYESVAIKESKVVDVFMHDDND